MDPLESVAFGDAIERRPYVKPFVRNLEVSVTEAGKFPSATEGERPESGGVYLVGPS